MFACGSLRGAWVLALFAVFSLGAGDAGAKPRVKPRPAEVVADIPIPKFSNSGGAMQSAREMPAQGARFFTIEGALAKADGRRTSGDAVRLASLRPDLRDAGETLARTRSDEPFGLAAFRAPEGTLWKKWQKVQDSFAAEERRLVDCYVDVYACDPASRGMLAVALRASELNGRERFEMVTRAVNKSIRYISDLAAHGTLDVWSSPLVTMAAGQGDCEDYAILKYKILREAGTPAADLQIILLRDVAINEDHAVLAARNGDTWYILDNRRAGFYVDADLPQYRPLFSLKHQGVKHFSAPFAASQDTLMQSAAPAINDVSSFAGGAVGVSPLLM